jgi:hypothetical protein
MNSLLTTILPAIDAHDPLILINQLIGDRHSDRAMKKISFTIIYTIIIPLSDVPFCWEIHAVLATKYLLVIDLVLVSFSKRGCMYVYDINTLFDYT